MRTTSPRPCRGRRAPATAGGRTVLVENLSYSTSLSGLLRQFEGFHMQEHAATLLEAVCPLATASSGCIKFLHVSAISNPLNQSCSRDFSLHDDGGIDQPLTDGCLQAASEGAQGRASERQRAARQAQGGCRHAPPIKEDGASLA